MHQVSSAIFVRLAIGWVTLSAISSVAHGSEMDDPVEAPVFKANSYWVYKIRSSSETGDSSLTLQWTLLYPNDQDAWVFSRARPDSANQPNTVRTITGVTDVAWSGRDSSGPDKPESSLLSFPLSVGKTWQSHFTSASDPSKVNCSHRAIAWEETMTAAGSFRTLRIEYRCVKTKDAAVAIGRPEEVVRGTRWYAPTVQNLVREIMQFPNGRFNSFDLHSFKLEK